MDRLVEATLRHGLVPPVVMEFPGITAGESSSFRHGFFDESVGFVEMVLGNGDVVRTLPPTTSFVSRPARLGLSASSP